MNHLSQMLRELHALAYIKLRIINKTQGNKKWG